MANLKFAHLVMNQAEFNSLLDYCGSSCAGAKHTQPLWSVVQFSTYIAGFGSHHRLITAAGSAIIDTHLPDK
jgi:hypothetical protein